MNDVRIHKQTDHTDIFLFILFYFFCCCLTPITEMLSTNQAWQSEHNQKTLYAILVLFDFIYNFNHTEVSKNACVCANLFGLAKQTQLV